MRVLVVDEDKDNCKVIVNTLLNLDIEVVVANSVTKGIAEVGTGVDVLFLNIRNINTNSEALATLIHQKKNSSIILIANDSETTYEEYIARVGADLVLAAPIKALEVSTIVRWRKNMRSDSVERKARILIVDDDKSQCLAVNEMLKPYFETFWVSSPNEGFKLLRRSLFDIVLTDFVMDEMSGIEFITAARLNHPNLLSVVMTGYSSRQKAVSSIKEGIFDYLEKPLNSVELVQTLERAWRVVSAKSSQSKLMYDLAKSNILLEQKISQMEEAERKLIRAVNHAKQAVKDKAMFMAKVSHELKNPLNSIIGFSELLSMDGAEPLSESQSESIRFIHSSGEHLKHLISDIQEMSSLDAREVPLVFERISAFETLTKEIAVFKKSISSSNISLDCDISESLPDVIGDKTRFQQVIINLLSNALKYSKPEGATIVIRADTVDDYFVQITVKDNGRGIPISKQAKLFMPFERLGAEHSEIQGTGIGLHISKTLVELMHGKIGFQSEEDKGSTFWFTIPIANGH